MLVLIDKQYRAKPAFRYLASINALDYANKPVNIICRFVAATVIFC